MSDSIMNVLLNRIYIANTHWINIFTSFFQHFSLWRSKLKTYFCRILAIFIDAVYLKFILFLMKIKEANVTRKLNGIVFNDISMKLFFPYHPSYMWKNSWFKWYKLNYLTSDLCNRIHASSSPHSFKSS